MHYTTQQLVWSRDVVDDFLAALSARPAAALLSTPMVILSHDATFDPQPTSDMADLLLEEAAFTGYTAGGTAPTFGGTPVILDNARVALLASLQWICGTATPQVTDTVFGYAVIDSVRFICGERFAGGVSFAASGPGQFLNLELLLPVPLRIVGELTA